MTVKPVSVGAGGLRGGPDGRERRGRPLTTRDRTKNGYGRSTAQFGDGLGLISAPAGLFLVTGWQAMAYLHPGAGGASVFLLLIGGVTYDTGLS